MAWQSSCRRPPRAGSSPRICATPGPSSISRSASKASACFPRPRPRISSSRSPRASSASCCSRCRRASASSGCASSRRTTPPTCSRRSPTSEREALLALLDEPTRREVNALLAYAEDEAGGLMSPRYVRLRPEMTVDEAISYLRRAARERVETIYYIYVLDAEQRLLGVVSFRELFAAPPEKTRARRDAHRRRHGARGHGPGGGRERHRRRTTSWRCPVLDAEGRIKGIVTVDDIVDVVREEATEDIQKIGGTQALDAPYLEVGVLADGAQARRLAGGAVRRARCSRRRRWRASRTRSRARSCSRSSSR